MGEALWYSSQFPFGFATVNPCCGELIFPIDIEIPQVVTMYQADYANQSLSLLLTLHTLLPIWVLNTGVACCGIEK